MNRRNLNPTTYVLNHESEDYGPKTYNTTPNSWFLDHSSGKWIANFHALLFKANSLDTFHSFKSFFTASSHVNLGRPLHLLVLSKRLIISLRTGVSGGLRWRCPNHLKRCWTSFSSIGATPTLSRISSFLIRSLLVWPQIHHNICISATLIFWTCCRLVAQHSAPYNIAGLIVVL